MSQFNTISEFNTYLSDNLKNLKLNDYFKEIHSKFYSELDISFMDYFLELCEHENEFIVDHIKLQEYGVLTNINSSEKIKRNLERLFLIKNEDYHVSQVGQQSETSRGIKYTKQYKLTPYAFKLCLIRSKNSKEYAKYYLLLEQVFKNYQEYQVLYNKNINKHLTKENKSLHEKIDKQSSQIEELLGYAKETKEQNEELNNKVDDLKDTMEDIKEDFKETADRSVPNPSNDNERHEFILLQHKELDYKFTFLREIQKLNENKISKKYKEYNIIKREYNANPIQLFKQFKESMKEYYNIEKEKIKNNKKLKNKNQLKKEVEKIKFCGNNLELQYHYTLNNLMDDLTNVCNEKFTNYNNYSESP